MPILISLHSFLEVHLRDMFSKSAVSLIGESWDTETESFPWGHIKPGHGADATNSTKLPSLQQPLPPQCCVLSALPISFSFSNAKGIAFQHTYLKVSLTFCPANTRKIVSISQLKGEAASSRSLFPLSNLCVCCSHRKNEHFCPLFSGASHRSLQ